jgi:hypothetical protein
VERGGQQQQIAIDPVTAVQELQQAPAEEEPVEEEDAEDVEMVEEEEPATE